MIDFYYKNKAQSNAKQRSDPTDRSLCSVMLQSTQAKLAFFYRYSKKKLINVSNK